MTEQAHYKDEEKPTMMVPPKLEDFKESISYADAAAIRGQEEQDLIRRAYESAASSQEGLGVLSTGDTMVFVGLAGQNSVITVCTIRRELIIP